MYKLIYRLFLIISVIFVITFGGDYVYAEDKEMEKLNVLFISSYSPNFISFNDQINGINAGLNNNVDLRVEYMNSKIIDIEENEKKFYSMIEMTLENYGQFDAIIAGDDDALEFCIRYREDLFEDIPISFLGVQQEERIDRALKCKLLSGVRETESIDEIISFIRRFNSDVDNIIFLNDSSSKVYSDITSKYKEFIFSNINTSEFLIDEFKREISMLNSNSAIISLYPNRFKNGGYLSTSDVNKLISYSTNNIPIYDVLSYSIGSGSIGGKVIDHFSQGKKAAEIVLGLLNGEDPKELYIGDDSSNRNIFDYKGMDKFRISREELPEYSTILNDPIILLNEYKDEAVGIFMIFIGLLISILALIGYIVYKRKYEKELLKAMHRAEDANELKTHFISNISHELKTPINVIMSSMQLVKIDKQQKKINCNVCTNKFDIINDNCNRLLRLLNNIIDVEKVELNDINLELKNINIVTLVEELVLSIIPYTKLKNLNVIFDTEEEEVIMAIDSNKIERALLNLLSNAIKFSKENGNIKVNLYFREELYITIEDEGIGIEKKDINKIFDKFMQIDRSLCRQNEGSGIGLSIAKSFIELHKGEIFVKSKIDEGTTFIVKLPIKQLNNDYSEGTKEHALIENVEIELSDIYT